MKDCLVYIFIIFLISFLLVLCVKDSNDKEGFNSQKISMETILEETNPSLAGSIEYVYTDPSMKNDDEYIIYNPDMYYNMLINNKNFKKEKQLDKTSNLMNFSKKPDERFTEYYTYETILPPMKFMKPSVVQDLTQRPVIRTNITQDFAYNDEKIYGLPELDPENDCVGRWLPWDESNCPDSRDRCTLKVREYKVIKEKKSNGKECTYEGDVINDGDIEIDYCFGSGNEDRCGLTENLCECDLDNYDDDECDIETMEEQCLCPAGYTLSGEGKCVSGSGVDNIPGINNLTQEQVNELLNMLESYKSDGLMNTEVISDLYSNGNSVELGGLTDTFNTNTNASLIANSNASLISNTNASANSSLNASANTNTNASLIFNTNASANTNTNANANASLITYANANASANSSLNASLIANIMLV